MGVKRDMRGKYLNDIIEKFRMERLFIERGKVMVMQVNEQKYFFEVQDDYTIILKAVLLEEFIIRVL